MPVRARSSSAARSGREVAHGRSGPLGRSRMRPRRHLQPASSRRVITAGAVAAIAGGGLAAATAWSGWVLYGTYVCVALALGVTAVSTLVWLLDAWRTPDSLTESSLADNGMNPAHKFSLIVPARHEEQVLERTLDRIARSDHPALEVFVVVGSDDEATRAAADRIARRYPEVVRVIVDASWPKNKPKALNAALGYCTGTITGVFVAEDDVHPSLLRRVDQCFQQTDADIVQAGVQLMNFHARWWTVHNVLEYYFWFRSRLHAHARQRFIPLGGNTVFVRTPLLQRAGGWDQDCLAEDCEIGVRLSALGARTAVFYEPALVTREECPPTLRAFVRQRTRWNQGYLQTLARGCWRQLPARQRALGVYILAMPYLMTLTWLLIPIAIVTTALLKAPIVITLLSFLPLLPMLCMLTAEVVGLGEFGRTFGERRRLSDYARLIIGLVPYQAVLAYCAARAVVREARGEHGWEKTTHLGLHLARGRQAIAMSAGSPVAIAEVGEQLVPVSNAVVLGQSADVAEAQVTPAHSASLPADGGRSGEDASRWPIVPAALIGRTDEELRAQLDIITPEAISPRPTEPIEPIAPREPTGPGSGRGSMHRLDAVGGWLIKLIRSHPDAAVLLPLLAAVGIVQATNLLHWPATQFDEGTYASWAWALQHGRLAPYTFAYGHPPLAWILLFFWTEVGGLFGRAIFSIDHGREFMVLVCLVSCLLLYGLGRRLSFSRVTAAASVILFALCPLSVFFHRDVLLDNVSSTFAVAAFLLALTPARRLWAFAGSGACFGLSLLSKETAFLLLPALVIAVVQNSDRRTRRYCLALFFCLLLLVAAFYPLYAALKGELLPGRGHVSLLGYLLVQLVTRQGTGSLFNTHSQTYAIVVQWLHLDYWLLGAALVLSVLTLFRRRTRAVTVAFLVQVVAVLRPGYLPNMYVITMLRFAALIVTGGIEAAWRKARAVGRPRAARALVVAVAGVVLAGVAVVAPRWVSGDHAAMTVRLDGPERAAELWLTTHVSHDQRLIAGDQYWIYLIEHGYNDQPMRGGFFSDTVVYYWPLDYDPAVQHAFPKGWRDFNYIVVTQAMVYTLSQTPTSAAAIRHSHVIASFGSGLQRIQIRQIEGATGLPAVRRDEPAGAVSCRDGVQRLRPLQRSPSA